MIKFFRKYNKQILAVVTVFLMISFVGGYALESLMAPSPQSLVRAEAFGQPITQGDLNAIRFETRILDGLGLPWRTPWLDATLAPLDELDYLLLVRESRRGVLPPSIERARVQLSGLGRNITKFCLDYGISSDNLEQAFAHFAAVQQQWELARQSVSPSEMEIRQTVKDQHETVNAEIVEISASPLVDAEELISEDMLQAHFEKYRDSLPTGEPLNFGYMIPDRVRVEYMRIAAGEIELGQAVTVEQAQRYWRDHQKEFLRPKDDDEPPPDADSRPAYYESFEEARQDVLDKLTREARLAEAREMASVIWNALREPWYNAQDDGKGFLQAPEVVTSQDHYGEVLKRLKDRLEHGGAVTVQRTPLFAAQQAAEQDGIGVSREDTQGGAPGSPFGAATHQVQGLLEESPPGARYLSLFETAPVWMIDGDNNLYIYRVVEVEKSHPPETLAEVRELVEADVRALRAFELAAAHAERILAAATSEGGLQSAWENYDGLPEDRKSDAGAWFEAKPFAKLSPELLPGFRFPVTVTDTAGARNEDGRLRHQIRSDEFVSEVFALRDAEGPEAAGIIEVPALEKCFVVQLAGVNHVTTADYQRHKIAARRELSRSRAETLKREWFAPERIRTRTAFKTVS